jgi:hypothetical protein
MRTLFESGIEPTIRVAISRNYPFAYFQNEQKNKRLCHHQYFDTASHYYEL